ncbi:hypothetical protein D3C76_1579050 [compost metagenome]
MHTYGRHLDGLAVFGAGLVDTHAADVNRPSVRYFKDGATDLMADNSAGVGHVEQ